MAKMTEFELFTALRPHYPAEQYALLPQVGNATGTGVSRHLDGVALGLWPSRGIHLHGFEIKSYRGDWLRELKNPAKAEAMHQFCNYWWIVAAEKNTVADGELPIGWGLMIYDAEKQSLKKVTAAKYVEAKAADISFIAAIMRKAQGVATPDGVIAKARAEGYAEGKEAGESNAKRSIEDYRKLKERVRTFERATNLDIDNWRPIEDLVNAIDAAMNGTVERYRKQLLAVAENIQKELTNAKQQG